MRKLRGLWKIIFGRTTMLVVLMAIQFVVLFGGFAILDSQMLSINYIISILAVIILMYLINTNQNSSFKLMWIIFILVVPVVGVTFYIYTRLQPGTKFISRRIEELMVEEDEYLRPDNETVRKISAESNKEIGLFRYLYEKGKYPVYNDASVSYFPSGEDKYRELVHQLGQQHAARGTKAEGQHAHHDRQQREYLRVAELAGKLQEPDVEFLVVEHHGRSVCSACLRNQNGLMPMIARTSRSVWSALRRAAAAPSPTT